MNWEPDLGKSLRGRQGADHEGPPKPKQEFGFYANGTGNHWKVLKVVKYDLCFTEKILGALLRTDFRERSGKVGAQLEGYRSKVIA